MKFDLMLADDPSGVERSIGDAAQAGLDGAWVAEARHDPFLMLGTAAARRTELTLGTAVAVGFARTPMLLASLANDLQLMTRGNFVLGLGTQIKPHIERRYSRPWSAPAPRMRDMILAIEAIWDCWQTGGPLAYAGDHYQYSLMTPAFSPGPNPYGPPPIYLGALGPGMTVLAGRYADGLIVHRFVSPEFIRDVMLPRVQAGLARRERPLRQPFQIVFPPFVISGSTEAQLRNGYDRARGQIAFFASTPGFQPVLERHGRRALGEQLHALSRAGRWQEMPALVGDDVVEALSVVSEPGSVRAELALRFADTIDRLVLSETSPEARQRSRVAISGRPR